MLVHFIGKDVALGRSSTYLAYGLRFLTIPLVLIKPVSGGRLGSTKPIGKAPVLPYHYRGRRLARREERSHRGAA